ncbi:tRNA lysidine(34) synthetase TilS [Alkalibacillus almallahensis]|uniref:tRNA lysidine(34) synthetase TilS n=1 Tax=Alkalibacillus almallahensis TaxID=1379154 RepID=UPI00141F62EF|nr:tRNA lysidine(34) synthetase TilS [Alkalibacillus almallahensis]NIK12691.1 tRNA(Ile)-lysidine synthase [Alkalibacillus almallahensis]
MEEQVKQFIQEQGLIQQGDELYVAVSGGVDSMALLHLLYNIQSDWNLTLTVLTVDHQLRGEESEADSLFVGEQATNLSIPCRLLKVDTKDYQQKTQTGVQEAARTLRYDAFAKEVSESGKLVLAHHGDDQIETMFMRLSKGVFPRGMEASKQLDSLHVIRPLLKVSKEQIRDYVNQHSIPFREDPSNASDDYTRNRFRHQLLPFVQSENPNIHNSAMDLHHELTEDHQLLNEWAEERMMAISQFCEQKVTFSINFFEALPLPLQRRGFHLILNYLSVSNQSYRRDFQSFKEWLASETPNSEWTLRQGLKAIKSYDTCTVTTQTLESRSYEIPLNIGDLKRLPNGWTIQVQEISSEYSKTLDLNDRVMVGSKSDVSWPLTVRTRRPGDRIRPKGLNGHKKVKDIFIDEKVPLNERDTWPVVTDANGRVLWIPLLKQSDWADLSDTRHIILSIDESES